jgi:hypothetical protein
MPKMSPLDLKAMLASEKADALAAISAARLMEERADAMDYYLGDMRKDMPAQEGRSRAVSTDVADTIEGLPTLSSTTRAAWECPVRSREWSPLFGKAVRRIYSEIRNGEFRKVRLYPPLLEAPPIISDMSAPRLVSRSTGRRGPEAP